MFYCFMFYRLYCFCVCICILLVFFVYYCDIVLTIYVRLSHFNKNYLLTYWLIFYWFSLIMYVQFFSCLNCHSGPAIFLSVLVQRRISGIVFPSSGGNLPGGGRLYGWSLTLLCGFHVANWWLHSLPSDYRLHAVCSSQIAAIKCQILRIRSNAIIPNKNEN